MLGDMYHIATSKICIIDGYNIPISGLKHKKGLEVIQIWHAMGAIKKFGYQILDKDEGNTSTVAKIMKMHSNYSMVTCTSNATKEFYAEAFNVQKENIKILGMPRVDYILGKNNEINEKTKKLYENYPYLKNKKNILYVPTFRKDKTLNIKNLIEKIDKNKYNLIIRLHPLDETKVDEKYLIDRKYNSFDLLKIADYVITDYSAIAFETSILDKPVFFYIYDIDEYVENRGLNINLKKEMKNATSDKIEDIIEIIEKDKYNFNDLKKFKEKYVQTRDTKNTERIVEYIKERLHNVQDMQAKE